MDRPLQKANESKTPLRIMGVDPGLNITGYSILQLQAGKLSVVEAGVIRGRDRSSLPSRILDIYTGVVEVLEAWQPCSLALEQLYSHYERPRTAILMGHARGAICLAAEQHKTPIVPYAATRIKKLLTGHGHATKAQIQAAVRRELNLTQTPEPADVADAIAAAVCHYHLSVKLSKTSSP